MEEMPNEGYGCAVANRFGQLLDDESDPFDILYAAGVTLEKKQKQKKKKEEPKKPSTTTKAGKKESQRDRKIVLPAGGSGQGR